MRWLPAATALAVAALLAGCASHVQTIDPQVRAELRSTTDQLSAAATTQDRSGANSALQKLFGQVAAAQAAGKLSAADAQSIIAAATRVSQDVQTLQPPPPVTVTVSPGSEDQQPDQQLQQGKGKDTRRRGGNR